MGDLLFEKIKESIRAVLPVSLVIFGINLITGFVSFWMMISFLIGAILLVLGMSLFTLGADISIITIGEKIGSYITKTKRLKFILLVIFSLGTIITIAEPDLKVLSNQVDAIPSLLLILTVGIGSGLFLLLSSLRIIYQWKMSTFLFISYLLVLLLSIFVPESFIALAFDSGGVTTGSMSVPLMIALGMGISSMRRDSKARDDSFGMIGICSIGPVLAVLILGLFYRGASGDYGTFTIQQITSFFDVVKAFLIEIPNYLLEVFIVFLPIVAFFMYFQKKYLRLKKKLLKKITKGLFYTYFGLVLFLVGVNVGFMPIGYLFGSNIAEISPMLLLVVSMLIGYLVVAAEPAVMVLNNQVEEITQGNISKKTMGVALAIAVCLSAGFAMLRVIYGIPVWYFLLPGYIFSVVMSYVVPQIFTAIAFDSGGIASGTMTATFLLPFAIGATEVFGGNVATDAFGLISIASLMPLITVQGIGLIYKIKTRKPRVIRDPAYNEEIISYESLKGEF